MVKKRILILNWRCPKNPQRGGAEKVTLIHATAWVKAGFEVYWLAGGFKGAKRNQEIEGVKILRYGSPLTVYLLAPFVHWLKFGGRFDLVIDQVHGLPFFTPLWAFGSRKLMMIHEVAQEIWVQMYPFPISVLGRLVEKIYFRLYRRVPVLTVSQSTADDLIRFGILKRNITIIPNGVDLVPLSRPPVKKKTLTLVFVSRLVRMKGIEEALRIFALVNKKTGGNSRFWVVGCGQKQYQEYLRRLASELGVGGAIKFLGYVSEKKKINCLQKAHFLIHTSVREGFGLVVLEANSQGTPAIVYNSPGLRDIVTNGLNGYQFRRDDREGAAQKIVSLFGDSKAYANLVKSSLREVKKYDWDLMTGKSISYLNSLL